MNPSAMKIARKFGISSAVAEALVVAGYDCPRKLRDAKDSDLAKHATADDIAALRKRQKVQA